MRVGGGTAVRPSALRCRPQPIAVLLLQILLAKTFARLP